MSDETTLNIWQEVEDLYNKLFLMSIIRKCDFKEIVSSAEKIVDKGQQERKNIFTPKGYEGLFFFETAARLMGSSLGEVYGLSEKRQEELLKEIVTDIDSSDYKSFSFDDDPEDGVLEITSSFSVQNTTDKEKFKKYYQNFYLNVFRKPETPERELPELDAYYPITFRKYNRDITEVACTYSITIGESIGPFKFDSPYVYDAYEVWAGNDGFLADFIENVIAEHKDASSENKMEDDTPELTATDEEDAETQIAIKVPETEGIKDPIDVKKPVIESEEPTDNSKANEEFIKYVWEDTRTIDLLDEFEGMGGAGKPKYKRIVIKNGNYMRYLPSGAVSFNLVIERGHGSDYVGDITFTEFKKGEDSELRDHVEKEINNEVIDKYKDKDQFFRFSKPFLLRAQNSSNRTGYGWEWDWSGGYGDYTEGTLYGETTNYFFVGAYITSGYHYEPNSRKPFVEKQISEDKAGKSEVGTTSNEKVFKTYQGKLKDVTQHSVLQKYLKIKLNGTWKYVPVAYDKEDNIIYIMDKNAKKYKNEIETNNYKMVDNLTE